MVAGDGLGDVDVEKGRAMKVFVAPARVAVFVLLSSACAPTLAGQLKDPGGEPVTAKDARVNVVRLDAGDEATNEATALSLEVDGSGGFSTRETLPPGRYLIEALVPGYALTSKQVDLADAGEVDLTLAPVGKVKAKTTRANTQLDAARGSGDATLTPPSL
jgi:hypothetical protein